MGLLQFFGLSDKEKREWLMSGIENWRRYPRPYSPAHLFLGGVEAIRLGLLNEEDTKQFKDKVRAWLAQEDAIKRPKPRSTKMQIMKKINEHKECNSAWLSDSRRLHTLEDFDQINEMRSWLTQEDAINNDKLRGFRRASHG